MTREEYKAVLLSKGFVFKESQEAWTQHKGEEDKYTHPDYKYYFYVKRTSDKEGSPYGFNAQVANGKIFDDIFAFRKGLKVVAINVGDRVFQCFE